jgi:rhomboid protease GluP
MHKYIVVFVSWNMFGMRSMPKLTPTIFLVTLNIAVYILTSVVGGDFIQTSHSTLLQYGQYNLSVWNGAYWQLLTSIFVHVDIVHIALNMLFLVIFGLKAEELFKTEEYLTIYMLSGLAGSLLTLFIMSLHTLSAGASGAIFGMYGAGIIYMRKTFGQSILGALIYSFLLLILTAGASVNVVAHFGGLATGLIIGYVLAKSRRPLFWIESI